MSVTEAKPTSDRLGVVRLRVTREVIEELATRDDFGNRLRVDWGQPDDDGFYEPTINVDYTDNLIVADRAKSAAQVRALLQPEGDSRGASAEQVAHNAAIRTALRLIERRP